MPINYFTHPPSCRLQRWTFWGQLLQPIYCETHAGCRTARCMDLGTETCQMVPKLGQIGEITNNITRLIRGHAERTHPPLSDLIPAHKVIDHFSHSYRVAPPQILPPRLSHRQYHWEIRGRGLWKPRNLGIWSNPIFSNPRFAHPPLPLTPSLVPIPRPHRLAPPLVPTLDSFSPASFAAGSSQILPLSALPTSQFLRFSSVHSHRADSFRIPEEFFPYPILFPSSSQQLPPYPDRSVRKLNLHGTFALPPSTP